MLLNDDIQFYFFSNELKFQKEINVIMYIIEFFLKIKSFHFNKISIRYEFLNFYVFIMFKMKYLINKM
jgi:hypothetical protein